MFTIIKIDHNDNNKLLIKNMVMNHSAVILSATVICDQISICVWKETEHEN